MMSPAAIVVGLGAAAALGWPETEDCPGTVIASFDRAVYVRFPGGVAALTDVTVPRGPIYLTGPVEPHALVRGEPFVVPGAWLATATVWEGTLPPRPPEDGRVLRALAGLAARSALLRPPWLDRWHAATSEADLGGRCRMLGGVGPGLTPSGDDALAGLLLAERVRNPEAEPRLVELAGLVDTHEISRAFLHWAARGQSIDPVHRLIRGDTRGADDLAAHGHTSGADLALGLWYGLTNETAPPSSSGRRTPEW